MSSTLHAVCTSLSDFFERFEEFVDSLDGKVRVSLGSIGESSTRTSITPGELTQHPRYQAYKQEALDGGAALLTTVAVEQDARSLDFRLSDWRDFLLPVDFDPKMVNRSWLSRLSNCFELRSEIDTSAETDVAPSPDRYGDAAYVQAVQHFEESAEAVKRTSHETASATRAFLADATRQFTQLKSNFEAALESEMAERRALFERHLKDSDGLDGREHAAVRRELLNNLQAMTDEAIGDSDSEETRRARRRVSKLCGTLMVFGLFLIAYSLLAVPVEPHLAAMASIEGSARISLPLTNANQPTATFIAGACLFVVPTLLWIVQTISARRRLEAHDEALSRYRRDLLRMSWVSELFLEAADKQPEGDSGRSAVPQVLLERFSRSLFVDDAEPVPGPSTKANGSRSAKQASEDEKLSGFPDGHFPDRSYQDSAMDAASGKFNPVLDRS